jgi:hypothetical protein
MDLILPPSQTDAYCSAPWADALIKQRALSERSELARLPSLHPTNLMWPNWASIVLGPFAETKGPRLPGRNPVCKQPNF